MNADWLEINDCDIDVQEVMRRVHERTSYHDKDALDDEGEDPGCVARALKQDLFRSLGALPGDSSTSDKASIEWIAAWLRDCDIVPRSYVIDWRVPILGPIHAFVRRIIHAEVRRYLLPMLEKQSLLNRKILESLSVLAREQRALARENVCLRQEVARLRDVADRGEK